MKQQKIKFHVSSMYLQSFQGYVFNRRQISIKCGMMTSNIFLEVIQSSAKNKPFIFIINDIKVMLKIVITNSQKFKSTQSVNQNFVLDAYLPIFFDRLTLWNPNTKFECQIDIWKNASFVAWALFKQTSPFFKQIKMQ